MFQIGTPDQSEPWFVGKDVSDTLGYRNGSRDIARHVDEEDKLNDKTALSLGQRGGWLINESGLYSLILSSKLPSCFLTLFRSAGRVFSSCS